MKLEQFKIATNKLESIKRLQNQISNCETNGLLDRYLVVNFGNGSNARLILEGDDVNTILMMVSALNKQKLSILEKEFEEL